MFALCILSKAHVSNTRPVVRIQPTSPFHVAFTPFLQLWHPLISTLTLSLQLPAEEEDRTPLPDPVLLPLVSASPGLSIQQSPLTGYECKYA